MHKNNGLLKKSARAASRFLYLQLPKLSSYNLGDKE